MLPKRKFGCRNIWSLTICLASICSSSAATYYVDFGGGDNSNNGLAAANPWKHCPGDPSASGMAGSKTLAAGDVVLFRSGVIYRGIINVNGSGTSANPIILKGDGWGTGKAIIEGADPWQPSWTVCPSADFCRGNPNFNRIYYATAPTGYADFRTGLYEDEDFLWYSQGPDPVDPFYYDNIKGYFRIPLGSSSIRQTRTTVTDPTQFTQSDANSWAGAYVMSWIQGNLVATKRITSLAPATDTITHEDLGANPYTDRDSYYSIVNHVSLLSRPGEYAYDPSAGRIYVWPRNSDNANDHSYSVQVRDTAITLTPRSHVIVEGFVVRHFAQGIIASSTASSGLIVRNNEVTKLRSAEKYSVFVNASDSTVQGNRIVDCMRSVGILSSADRLTVRSNFVSRTSRQGIWFLGATRSLIADNTVTDMRGSHANGISIYSSSSDILVANNVISLANSPLTFEYSRDLTFYGNVVDGGDNVRAASDWSGNSGRVAFVNNTFVRNPESLALYILNQTSVQYVMINNILDGGGPPSTSHDYNLYLGSPGWTLAAHEEIQNSLTDVFASPGSPDWRPKAGGRAIDTGISPMAYLPTTIFPSFDFLVDPHGNARGAGSGWDRGAYEFGTAVPDVTPPVIDPPTTGTFTPHAATITFGVSELSRAILEYGTSTTYGNTRSNGTPQSLHSFGLTGLTPATTYHYRLQAVDAAGNRATSADFTFATLELDTVAPTVAVSSPGSGAIVTQVVNVVATAADNVGVVGVTFLIDGQVLGTEDLSAPYSAEWSTYDASNGTHTLIARARDAIGNATDSAAVTVSVQNQTPDLRTGMVAYWPLEETSGLVVRDVSGSGLNGTLVNNPQRISGKLGRALEFGGTNHVLVSHQGTLEPDLISISLWVRKTAEARDQALVQKLAVNDTSGYGLYITTTGQLLFYLAKTGQSASILSSTDLAADIWHHVVATFDGTTARLYLAGVEIAAGNAALGKTTDPLYIGIEDAGASISSWRLKGSLDDIRIYNRVLAPNIIRALFAARPPAAPMALRVVPPQ